MERSFAYKSQVMASLTAFSLMSCTSLDANPAKSIDQPNDKSAMIEGFGLAPRALDPGECGLFVWTGTTRRFMLFVQDGARAALAGGTGELELVPAVIPTGADQYGQFPAQIFRDKLENLYTLKFEAPISMDQGLRYSGGTWRFETPDGWDKVIPVYGLSTCLPSEGIGGAIPVSNEVLRDQDPYETKLRKLVINLQKEQAFDRSENQGDGLSPIPSPGTALASIETPTLTRLTPANITLPKLAAIPRSVSDQAPNVEAESIKALAKIQIQPAVMSRSYPSTTANTLNSTQATENVQTAHIDQTQIETPSYDIQIAALRTRKGAEIALTELQEFAPQYGSQPFKIIRADLGEKGVYYRLRLTGFASSKSAKTVCWKLRTLGQDCFPIVD